MKILFLNDDYPPYGYGGATVVVERLAKKMAEDGHKVFVVTTVRENYKLGITNYEKSKDNVSIYHILSDYNLRWRAWKSVYNRQAIKKLEKIIKEIQPDVIHIHNVHTYLSYASIKLAKKSSKIVFLTAHDSMLFYYDKFGLNVAENDNNDTLNFKVNFWQRLKFAKKRFNPFREIAIKYYIKYVDKIFAISQIQKKALEVNGFKNIEVIYNGVDIENFSCNLKEIDDFKEKFGIKNKKIIFYGGRLSGAKGIDLAIKYLAEVKKQIPNAVLFIAGKKEIYEKYFLKDAQSSNVKNDVIAADWLDKDEMKKAFSASDVCITPSRYFDPFNLFNIEAMVAKKPVVGTCFGGTPEIIEDGKTGFVVNPLQIEEYSEKIVKLLKNDELAKRMGECGYSRVKEKFSLDKQCEETLEWYERFI